MPLEVNFGSVFGILRTRVKNRIYGIVYGIVEGILMIFIFLSIFMYFDWEISQNHVFPTVRSFVTTEMCSILGDFPMKIHEKIEKN